MASAKKYEESLVQRFVASFEKLDSMKASENTYPIKVQTEPQCLEPIYSQLTARFPRLYEKLVLTYRWADVDLQSFTLLANPPGVGLGGLLHQISKDPTLWNCLRKAGYMQFAKGPDVDYDPVCVDIRSRTKKGKDYRIVKIDHEQILCYDRVKIVKELAPSFEDLMQATIRRANLDLPH